MTITRDVGNAFVIIFVNRVGLVDAAGCSEQYDTLIERAVDHSDLFDFGGADGELEAAELAAQAALLALREAMQSAGHTDIDEWEPEVLSQMVLTCEAYLAMKRQQLEN